VDVNAILIRVIDVDYRPYLMIETKQYHQKKGRRDINKTVSRKKILHNNIDAPLL
jgi:hypothetical protein